MNDTDWKAKQAYERLHAVELTIAKLRKESETATAEANRLAALLQEYPDLLKQVGRWEKVAYYSKTVNARVNRFDMRHNCGCCLDSPLEIWPYLDTPNGKVYSNPPMFFVGERHHLGGDVPSKNWKEPLIAAGIPEDIIGAIDMHFKESKEERIEAAESASASEEDDYFV